MRKFRERLFGTLLGLALLVFSSCSDADVASFAWKAADGKSLAFSQQSGFPKGKEGSFTADHARNTFALRKPYAMETGNMLAVRMAIHTDGMVVAFVYGTDAGKNNREVRFAPNSGHATFYLRAPENAALKILSVSVDAGKSRTGGGEVLAEVESVAVLPAFHGYERLAHDEYRISDGLSLEKKDNGMLWTIEQPFRNLRLKDANKADLTPVLVLKYAAPADADIVIRSGVKVLVKCASVRKGFSIPASVFAKGGESISLLVPDSVQIEAAYADSVPPEAATLVDPGVVLLAPAPPEGQDFAFYRWDLLPNVLMFDFRSYETQDAYLKRLAFFVEKQGFAGRLAKDEEIASLHGWNAHDYKAEDLAAFFSEAKKTDFPLSEKEKSLRDLLVTQKIIAGNGQGYKGLGGAIIAISRESAPYLRHMFLTHESTHAVFFTDESYRRYCISLWNDMSPKEKWFWSLYFGWMNYDTGSAYLMANEMQAYLLQQPVYRAEEYFQKTLVERLLEHHPELEKPLQDYMAEFGPEFARKAALLEKWLKEHYGFGAGMTFFVR